MLLGLCGEKGDGKTTVASHLARMYYQVELHSFASTLKTFCIHLGAPTDSICGTQTQKEQIIPGFGISGRALMKNVGQSMKKTYGQSFYVDQVMREVDLYPQLVHIVTDVRFAAEALAVRSRGGLLVRIRNPGRDTSFDIDDDETERLSAIACPKEVSGRTVAELKKCVDELVLPLGLVPYTFRGEF